MPVKTGHGPGTELLIAADAVPEFLGVKLLREGGGTLEVAEHHR